MVCLISQYAYMTYFFANPLSIFSDVKNPVTQVEQDHYEALRNLNSFQKYTVPIHYRSLSRMLTALQIC